MSKLSEQSIKKFPEGYNCSQIVLSAFSEKYGMSQEDAYRIATGLGGGARCGELCGAVSGAIMVIGLKYGNQDQKDGNTKMLCYQKTSEFNELFKQRHGSIVCHDLLGCNIGTTEGMEFAKGNGIFLKVCPVMIKAAIELLEELGY